MARLRATSASVTPASRKLSALAREAWWLAAVAVGIYLALALFSFDVRDPGFSHSGVGEPMRNLGGPLGAWLSDVLLYIFGLSAWWWVALAIFFSWWGYGALSGAHESDHLSLLLTGFALLLVASTALEAIRFDAMRMTLPFDPGGVLGVSLEKALGGVLGGTGAVLALLVMAAAGLSLFLHFSWLTLFERIGTFLEGAYWASIKGLRQRRDARAGEAAQARRNEVVEQEKRRLEEAPPVKIERAPVAIPKSERVEREKQATLFDDIPPSTLLPPIALLDPAEAHVDTVSAETLEYTSRLIERKLSEFGVAVKVVAAYPGPVITRYEIEPATGVKGAQIVGLAKDLARALGVVSIRVVETIPGKTTMGLEIPNTRRETVRLSEILASKAYADQHAQLTIALGKDIGGHPVVGDLARMPHLLVAGTTGSGKSVAINAMILSLIYKTEPSQVRLILVDPKMLELSVYEGIPHLLAPVVTDMRQAATALAWCVAEMDRRYKRMSWLGVRNLSGYNHKIEDAKKAGKPILVPDSLTPDNPEPLEPLPLIVVVIDELADLMMVAGKKVEELIARLAQKARASGIHLILATQRPSVDVITGLIKANIPTRVAFQVSSKIDSRTILDQMGAEALLGQGDMLFLPPGAGLPQRIHGAFVADNEVHRVVEWIKQHAGPNYLAAVLAEPDEEAEAGEGGADAEADPLYDEAVAFVLKSRRASISAVQRQLRIGYNRAARMIEAMESAGLVSPMGGSGNREVLAKGHAEG
jgi:S-DNA-T family DNA segregation ATPase FtsK/SpoIIIE